MIRLTLVVFTLFAHLEAEESNSGIDKKVLESCDRRESNRTETKRLAGGDTAPGCREQIEKSLEECLKNPGITQEDYRGTFSQVDVGTNLRATVYRQIAAYESGKQKLVRARAACEKEDDYIFSVCKQKYQELKASLAQYRNVAGVNEAAQKVQFQMAATQKARESAMKTVEEQALCFKYQADIYDEAIAKTRAAAPDVEAQPASNEAGGEKIEKVSLGSEAEAGRAAQPASLTESATPVAAASGGAGTAAGGGVKAPSAVNSPATSAWSSLGSGAQTVGSKAVGLMSSKGANVLNAASAVNEGDGLQFTTSAAGIGATMTNSRILGAVGGLPGAVITALINPDPTSKCAGDFSDPVQAKAAGCEVNVHVNSASYDRAIKTLRND